MSRPQPLLHLLCQLQQAPALENLQFIVSTDEGLRHLSGERLIHLIPQLPTSSPAQTCDCELRWGHVDQQLGKVAEDIEIVAEELSDIMPYYTDIEPFRPDESVFIGTEALEGGAKDRENIAVGLCAGTQLEGTGNVLVGSYAGADVQGELTDVVAVGHMAMRDHGEDRRNVTALGAYTQATGNDQVVLGDHRTTTYTHSATHRRADRRDMHEPAPLELGLDFVLNAQPLQYRQDFREAYIDWDSKPVEPTGPGPEPQPPEIPDTSPDYQPALVAYRSEHARWVREQAKYENELVIHYAQLTEWFRANRLGALRATGEHAGRRTHFGFDAEQLQKLCEQLGLDAALFHDHSVNGGEDAKSYAPDMLVPILWNAVQQMWTMLHSDQFADTIASRLLQRHSGVAEQVQAPAGAVFSAQE